MAMFVRYYTELIASYEAAAAALQNQPKQWLPLLSVQADERGQSLLGEVGFGSDGHRVQKRVQIELGEGRVSSGSRFLLPISWQATGPSGLFPVLEGDLEVAPLGRHHCQLSLSARYQPPFGLLGKAVDRALLSRVAEATVKDFVERVADALTLRLRLAS